jgi:hypothetical protein
MKTINEAAREYAASRIKDKNRQPDNDIFFAAKEAFEEGAVFVQRWIPVEESMPKKDTLVLTIDYSDNQSSKPNVSLCYWNSILNVWNSFCTMSPLQRRVTHWKYTDLPK